MSLLIDLQNFFTSVNFFTNVNNPSEHISDVNTKSQIFYLHHLGNRGLLILYNISVILLLYNCNFPCNYFVGQQCVDLIITELGVFEVVKGEGLKLIEIAANVDISELISSTGCEFSVADDLKEMEQVEIDES
jgi:acyl CoA:acetate/3-ketoacid CoA transferase beta subunit